MEEEEDECRGEGEGAIGEKKEEEEVKSGVAVSSVECWEIFLKMC